MTDARERAAQEETERLRVEARILAADPVNRAIIRHLQEDGRMSFSDLARELDTSEATVRNRVKAMTAARVFRVLAVVDPTVLGHTEPAMIGVKLAAGADLRAVANRFKSCEEVTYVLFVSGRYDLLVEVVCEDQEKFRVFLLQHCYGKPDIASVEPMIGMECFKSLMKWGQP